MIIKEAALSLERAGADFILLCTNTMHKILPLINPFVNIPFLHIAEATAIALLNQEKHNAILLGTKFTMQESFYKDILNAHKINVIVPGEKSIEKINHIIFNELCIGKIETESKRKFLEIIDDLKRNDQHIDSVILGCTEIGLLLDQESSNLPLFDTTVLHVNEAIKHALEQETSF